MFEILRKSLAIGVVTSDYPASAPDISEMARGRPEINFSAWTDAREAAAACPTQAIASSQENGRRTVELDLGKCIFCGLCAEADRNIRLLPNAAGPFAYRSRPEMKTTAVYSLNPDGTHKSLMAVSNNISEKKLEFELTAAQIQKQARKIFGRSLHIRQVDAGSCNGCEIEIIALNNPVYDLERFGIHFVASPRHADMLLVTGPVTRNMELALRKTYEAMPEPRFVVAVGACGCSGGIFGRNYATVGPVDAVLPVDVYVPGCPPNPHALLCGILTAIGRWPRPKTP